MALIRTLSHARTLVVIGLPLAVTAALLPNSALGTPASPTPTIASVTQRLDTLANQAEALTEQLNAAQAGVVRSQHRVETAQLKAKAASSQFDAARRRLAEISLAQYQSGSFSRTGAILTSTSDQNYLDTLVTQDLLATHSAEVTSRVDRAAAGATRARAESTTILLHARATRNALKLKREKVISQTTKYRSLLATLTAAQRQSYSTRGAPTTRQVSVATSVHAGNAAAQRAVDFAIAQVGKPYVFASAGPDSFDCSGLTQMAWKQGGVSLPHFAAAQINYGTRISYDALQPGDLVFLYGDLHHVEIYIGKGLAVSAPQPGENVKIVQVANSRSDFAGAVRLT